MKNITITTKRSKEVIDITEHILDELPKDSGICHIFLTHTTAAPSTADLDPGTDLDMIDAFNAMVPKLEFRHGHYPDHTPDHILSSIIGTSLSLPVNGGDLMLGDWQRVVLIEFDGPRKREVILKFIKD